MVHCTFLFSADMLCTSMHAWSKLEIQTLEIHEVETFSLSLEKRLNAFGNEQHPESSNQPAADTKKKGALGTSAVNGNDSYRH